MREVYLDTEFLTNIDGTYGLLSVGMIDSAGQSLYLVNEEAAWQVAEASEFHRAHTLPHLRYNKVAHLPIGTGVRSVKELRFAVHHYFSTTARSDTTVYAWCGSQDLNRIHALWNHDWAAMPDSIPRWFQDLKALTQLLAVPDHELPTQAETTRHHALWDAKHDMAIHQHLKAEALKYLTARYMHIA